MSQIETKCLKLTAIIDGNREIITIIDTICADDYVLPSMVIYKAKAYYSGWHTNLEDEDPGTVFALSDKGWTNQVLGVEYLKLLFNS